MISVSEYSDGFKVTVESGSTTSHQVTLSDAYYQQLTGGRCSKTKLIESAFAFLLEREPNTSILSSFDLTVISRYFPEFESEIPGRI